MKKDIWYLISYYFHKCNLIHRPKLNYLRINDKACQNCIKNNKLQFIRHINHYSIWFGYDNWFSIHFINLPSQLNPPPHSTNKLEFWAPNAIIIFIGLKATKWKIVGKPTPYESQKHKSCVIAELVYSNEQIIIHYALHVTIHIHRFRFVWFSTKLRMLKQTQTHCLASFERL